MTEHELTAVLQKLARESVPPADIDLWPRISRTLPRQAGSPRRAWARRRLRHAAPALLVAALLLGVLMVIGPDVALAALGRLIGYVPGIGFIQQTPVLRAIAHPVQQERDGVTVVVEQAVADSERTIIRFRVEGLSLAAANAEGEGVSSGSRPVLRLADGTVLSMLEGEGRGWGSGFEERLIFPALPAAVETLIFEIERLPGMPAGAVHELWQLELRLLPASDAAIAALPAIEQTPVDAAVGLHGIALRIDRFVELGDGFFVEGSLNWDDRYPAVDAITATGDMGLTDSAGLEIPIEPSQPDSTAPGHYRSAWAFHTNTVALNGPLTLTMRSVAAQLAEPVSFELDAGPAPRVGQSWRLNRQIEILGLPVRILSARFIELRGMQGFEIRVRPDPALLGLDLGISGPGGEPLGEHGAGGSRPDAAGDLVATALTDGAIHGPVRLTIPSIRLAGPWTAQWEVPPRGDRAAQPLATPAPCLNAARWAQALDAEPAGLPAGLTGRIAGYGPMTGQEGYVIYTANLDGSELRILGEGTWPSLSPDGARAAYSAPGGLNLADHRTGEVWHLAGTLEGDYGPRWSPDGARIAFVRVADLNLYVANADGSALRPVTSGVEYELLAGWSPDGARLYYAVPEAAGLTLRSLDLATGAVDELFAVGAKDVPSLSPDGQWVAYADRVFGAMNYGLYLRSVDGSAPRLLAHVEGQIIAGHLWSPDGRWILASIYDSADLDPRPMPTLIEVDTCRIVRLPWLAGYVQGWAP